MKKWSKILCGCSLLVLMPAAVNAAGTYYNGTYQSPQTRYNSSAFSNTATRSTSGVSAYNQARYSSAGYNTTGYSSYVNRYGQNARNVAQQNRSSAQQPVAANKSNGFHVDTGLSYKTGMWQFDMASAGSILRYDNLSWGVFDINAGYDFMAGNTALTLEAGLEYGIQMGNGTMIDDDVTNGGFEVAIWPDDTDKDVSYMEYGHALSVGESKDGDMLGLRAGIGLKDFFTWGKVKITPSIGWRHLKYKVETSNNYGMKIDTIDGNNGCITDGGMTQCWPAIAFFKVLGSGDDTVVQYTFGQFEYIDINGDSYADVVGIPLDNANGDYVDTMESFYFHQSDISHSYEVTWTGPYLAFDMLYDINQNNAVTARVELGLPSYNATADQPYRGEWQHPKSIEDEAGFGSAFHLGLGANWRTALTDKVALTLGITYDYYSVGGADATTYLNPEYYQALYDSLLAGYNAEFGVEYGENYMLNGFVQDGIEYAPDPDAVYINQVRSNGWKDTIDDEIDSFFKSLGVRVGLNIKF